MSCCQIVIPHAYFLLLRLAGSHLDIKKHYRRSGAQVAKYKHLPVIHVNASFNNTVITISDQKGKD